MSEYNFAPSPFDVDYDILYNEYIEDYREEEEYFNEYYLLKEVE